MTSAAVGSPISTAPRRRSSRASSSTPWTATSAATAPTSTAASTRSARRRPPPTRARDAVARFLNAPDAARDRLRPQRDRGHQPRGLRLGPPEHRRGRHHRPHRARAPLQPRALAAARPGEGRRPRVRALRRGGPADPRLATRSSCARGRSSWPSRTSPTAWARSTRCARWSPGPRRPAPSSSSTAPRPCRTCRSTSRPSAPTSTSSPATRCWARPGSGALWARRELLEAMPPFLSGGEMISSVHLRHTTFNEMPHKFEAGTPDIAAAIGLGAAVDYLAGARHGARRCPRGGPHRLRPRGAAREVPGLRIHRPARGRRASRHRDLHAARGARRTTWPRCSTARRSPSGPATTARSRCTSGSACRPRPGPRSTSTATATTSTAWRPALRDVQRIFGAGSVGRRTRRGPDPRQRHRRPARRRRRFVRPLTDRVPCSDPWTTSIATRSSSTTANPTTSGRWRRRTPVHEGSNPLCGDRITMMLALSRRRHRPGRRLHRPRLRHQPGLGLAADRPASRAAASPRSRPSPARTSSTCWASRSAPPA